MPKLIIVLISLLFVSSAAADGDELIGKEKLCLNLFKAQATPELLTPARMLKERHIEFMKDTRVRALTEVDSLLRNESLNGKQEFVDYLADIAEAVLAVSVRYNRERRLEALSKVNKMFNEVPRELLTNKHREIWAQSLLAKDNTPKVLKVLEPVMAQSNHSLEALEIYFSALLSMNYASRARELVTAKLSGETRELWINRLSIYKALVFKKIARGLTKYIEKRDILLFAKNILIQIDEQYYKDSDYLDLVEILIDLQEALAAEQVLNLIDKKGINTDKKRVLRRIVNETLGR